ncbi:MAG: DUF1329 domain-containing protein [Sinobacteraceae bacterium]|nr:DUF1329 domain-containing protein [Nevskia sp.]MDI3259331.1 DUF1329 domain-containing protein [Nevskiaceae bacterium]
MTKSTVAVVSFLLVCGFGAALHGAQAKVSEQMAAQLDGPKYTCQGAIRAGSADGVAAYTGKWNASWPGMKHPYGYEPGPYADEKPLFTITAQNMAQYADKLTEGEKALLKKYPNDYRMNVYPSHRDFAFDPWVCAVVKKNAVTSEVIHDGKGITGIAGGIPFPFPQSGLEAIWNAINPHRAWTEEVTYDVADVYNNGSVAWGKNHFKTMNPGNNNKDMKLSYQDKYNAFFYTAYLLPERQKGFVAVGYQPNDFTNDATQSWQYLPGIRRVREAPEVGFDYPVPPAGMRTVDDDYGFNGSPERYTWKLIGKKEMYVPYNNFKINDPAIKLTQLTTPHTINPDDERYELHRVWVIEGDLKPGVRHIYHKRLIYCDEDTWLTLWADNYDARGQLYRVTLVNYFWSQESHTYHRSTTVYHDLSSGAYEATYMPNAAGDNWWRINQPMTVGEFSPQAAARGGH